MLPSGTALLQLTGLSRAQAPGIGWPPEEDARLSEVMANHKGALSVDWEGLCVEHGMARRSARECHDRWTRYLRPGRVKEQWTEQEDAIVLRAIFSGGFSSQWQDLVPQLPGRKSMGIRHRWINVLNPALNTLPFSRDDDCRLWRGHKELGKRWVEISVKVFQSTRSERLICTRWRSVAFKEFIAKEFGAEACYDANLALDNHLTPPPRKCLQKAAAED